MAKNPDFILTFMVIITMNYLKFIVQNLMKNSKLFIFQHGDGGIYADDNDSYNIAWHKKICDKYFVWGRIPRMDMKVFSTRKNV